uniref:PiggyBac transposable element-derived protein 2-like n=1 Tax=Diabrotica virgifera virgifera TaxID=50390 RepID=A0A6P7FTS7_DIAVI
MTDRRYWTKPLTLSELMDEIENLSDNELPDDIIIFPPKDGEETDEESGDEDAVEISNLPGNQLRGEAEIVINDPKTHTKSEIKEDEDDIPLHAL